MRDTYKKQVLLNLEAGKKEVLIPNSTSLTIRSKSELYKIDSLPLDPVTSLMAAPHPGCGCGMGSDPKTSLVDSSHRVQGTKSLYNKRFFFVSHILFRGSEFYNHGLLSSRRQKNIRILE